MVFCSEGQTIFLKYVGICFDDIGNATTCLFGPDHSYWSANGNIFIHWIVASCGKPRTNEFL